MHVARRYDTNERSVPAQGKSHMYSASRPCHTECVKSRFCVAVRGILCNDQRLMRKYFFSFGLCDAMLAVLAGIARIPVESNNGIK